MGAKTDFAAMPDDNLRQWIAQRRGWTDVHRAQDGMWWGLPPGGRSTYLPDWTGDLNAAWELFAEMDKAELCAHSVLTYDSATFHRFGHDGTAESAARAIAEAWAQWKEQNNDD